MADLKSNEWWVLVHPSGRIWPGSGELTKGCLINALNRRYEAGAYQRFRRRGYRPAVAQISVVRVGR
ncbi:MAG: hypothetical protein DRJ65_00010 [Acidobacteria bacterium]|nr:MAG: hypothetical protein DRJ65_00010 [Acidobacteriota bacterium]